MYCKNCGHQVDDRAAVCPHCGVVLQKIVFDEPKKSVNGLGIAGFIVSLLSLYFGIYFCIASLIGPVLSIVACANGKKHSANGFAIAGLVIGIISVLIWGLIWICVGAVIGEIIGMYNDAINAAVILPLIG